MIDKTSGCGAVWHAGDRRIVNLGLSQREAAMLLDHSHAQAAIAADAGKDYGDRFLTLVFGKSAEEGVYRPPMLPFRRWLHDTQSARLDRERRVRRDDVDAVLGNDVPSLASTIGIVV